MLDKIKGYALYIILPITALFAFIFKLLYTNRQLREEKARNEIRDQLKETIGEMNNAKKDADRLESDYDKLKSDYDSDRNGGVPGDS